MTLPDKIRVMADAMEQVAGLLAKHPNHAVNCYATRVRTEAESHRFIAERIERCVPPFNDNAPCGAQNEEFEQQTEIV